MAPVSISVSGLRCAAVDPAWREAFRRGESPPERPLPDSPAVAVHGARFHALVRRLVGQLKVERDSELEDHDALLARLYSVGGGSLLEQLLAKGRVESASALVTAFHAFCDRLLQLRERTGFQQLFVAEEFALTDVPLQTPHGKLFVSGVVDSIRRLPSGELEVVDYKLSMGNELDKDALQVALYRRLLRERNPSLNPSGSVEYFLPGLQVTPFNPRELDSAYDDLVAPFLAQLVGGRKAASGGAEGVAQPLAGGSPMLASPEPMVVLGAREPSGERLSIPIGELKRHMGVLGSSGSGKTSAALGIVEQVLEAGVPALLVDRKGDLARYADPKAWQEDDERSQARAALAAKVDVQLYTPGHRGGRALGIRLLPELEGLDRADQQLLLRSSAQALGDMLHLRRSGADGAKRGVLQEAMEALCEVKGAPGVAQLVELLERRDAAFERRLGVLVKHLEPLLVQLKSFELMNPELTSRDVETLDVRQLLGLDGTGISGKTRMSIVNTRFLDGDEAALFWVSLLLRELNRFAARRPSDRLQALVLLDEADLYLPATKVPPTKAPLENLLKRARSAGIGVVLVTQSPGDLDYRCRENVNNWLVGRVKERRALEKIQPLATAVAVDGMHRFPNQRVGEFHILTERLGQALRVCRSVLNISQLGEQSILQLAQRTATRTQP